MLRILVAILCLGLPAGVCAAGVPEGLWEPRASEVYNLEAGESVQLRLAFDELPVRTWILSVEGGLRPCDLNVFRMKTGAMLHQQHDESRHRVRVPWGRGEAVTITLTANRRTGGSYTVKFLAPPAEEAPLAYGYDLNRALEAMETGRTGPAEIHLRDAAVNEPRDAGVAYLLMASLARNRNEMERAAGLLDMALAEGLPEELEHVELELRKQLARVQKRGAPTLRDVDFFLSLGNGDEAVERITRYLEDDESRSFTDWDHCEAYRRLGHARQLMGELIPAQEAMDRALTLATDSGQKALVYHRLALLQFEAGNRDQARRALAAARDLGLPPDLDADIAPLLEALEEE